MRALLAILVLFGVVLGTLWWFTAARGPQQNALVALDEEASAVVTNEPAVVLLDDPETARADANAEGGVAEDERAPLAVVAPPRAADVDENKPAAPLELRVVDGRSGLSLPRYLVRVADAAGRKFDVISDDVGGARTEPLALGPVQVIALDHAGRRGKPPQFTIDHVEANPRPHVVTVPSGATYRVAFTPDAGPDWSALELRINLTNDGGESGWTDWEPLRAAEPYRREAEPRWVRFPAIAATLQRAKRIEARSRDGLWSGSCSASVAVGESAESARIFLERCAVLTGQVTCAGVPVEGVQVSFRALPKPDDKSNYVVSGKTNSKGVYQIQFVRAREGKLRAAAIQYQTVERDLSVEPGVKRTEDFDVALLPTVGRVAGTIVSETGAYAPKFEVTLTRQGRDRGELPQLRTKVRWTKPPQGPRIGEFDFGPVPLGKYRVECPRIDWFEWTPRRIDVDAPKEDVSVRILDAVLTADFAFDLRDSDNGLELDRWHLALDTYDGERRFWIDSSDVFLKGYPEEKVLRWRLDRDGYPSRIGDMSSFASTTIVDGRRRRTCEIAVQPGWSEVVRVTRGKGDKPLPNAIVSLDGREAGKTSDSGQVRVSAREKPQRIDVALEGWSMDTKVDLRPPAQRSWRRYVDVRMWPARK